MVFHKTAPERLMRSCAGRREVVLAGFEVSPQVSWLTSKSKQICHQVRSAASEQIVRRERPTGCESGANFSAYLASRQARPRTCSVLRLDMTTEVQQLGKTSRTGFAS